MVEIAALDVQGTRRGQAWDARGHVQALPYLHGSVPLLGLTHRVLWYTRVPLVCITPWCFIADREPVGVKNSQGRNSTKPPCVESSMEKL